MNKFFIYIVFVSALVLTSCKNDIENLSISKSKVTDYYESGAYETELKEALKPAYEELNKSSAKKGDAIVFDVDETILSNYAYIKSIDFGYNRQLWDKYLLNINADPIEQTVKFYKAALEKNYSIIFLTARTHDSYEHTLENLRTRGIEVFDTLICRTRELEDAPASEFKQDERKLLTESGYNIFMCVGDQDSDLLGDNTGIKIKLPNKLYLTK